MYTFGGFVGFIYQLDLGSVAIGLTIVYIMSLQTQTKNNCMNSNTGKVVIQMLAFGLILAVIKIVYLFFDPFNILDFIVFLAAGYMLGGKVPANRRYLGLMLAVPTFALCLYFVVNNGYTSIMNGIGTSYAISLIVIPVATYIGVLIKAKRTLRVSAGKK